MCTAPQMVQKTENYDVIILGAGGAGLMCAASAGQRGKRVLLIDHAEEPGKKILISGGGRCNFTNLNVRADRFLSANRHYMKSALSRYQAQDFVDLVNRYNIAWHEKTLGQLFCDGSARQIVNMLMEECTKAGVEISLGSGVSDVRHADGRFHVQTSQQEFTASAMVVATGGPSIPKMGATGFAYDLARQFGVKVVEPRPALVPLTLGGEETLFRSLSGISSHVRASCGKTSFDEAALFTHQGLSGPAILQISSYWRHGDPVTIDFMPALQKSDKRSWLCDAKRQNFHTAQRGRWVNLRITGWRISPGGSPHGASCPMVARVLPRQRLPPAVSAPRNFPLKPWQCKKWQGCILLERRSM